MKLIIIGFGGFIGAVLRYELSGWTYRLMGSRLPYGTLAVNVIGSFILGFFLVLAEGRFAISPQIRNFVAVGILGAFTTFSTFSFETMALLQQNLFKQALLNILLNVILALTAVWMGMVSAKLV
ncbi:MAG: fluoride efflux transporter CrcB [Calditrichaceae bacterium]